MTSKVSITHVLDYLRELSNNGKKEFNHMDLLGKKPYGELMYEEIDPLLEELERLKYISIDKRYIVHTFKLI